MGVTPTPGGDRSIPVRVVGILVFGVTIGIIGSLLAVGFVELISQLEMLLRSRGNAGSFNIWWLLSPVAGGLVVGLLICRTRARRPETITDIIDLVQVGEGKLRWKDGIINAIAAIIAMGSGASVGPYGPLATLGAHLGNLFTRWSRAEINLAIGCGVAATISAAFSAPIAAVVFVHEVILRHNALRSFAPITIASSTAFFISAYWLGRPPLFMVEAERSIFAPEFLAFVLIGIVGALIATLFMRMIQWSTAIAAALQVPGWIKPAIAGLGVGLIAQWLPDVLGIGRQILSLEISSHQLGMHELMWLLPAKMLATALCLGFGFAGGGFSPALMIGVLAGALMGTGAEALLGENSSGITFYAICGMVAVTGPVIGGPMTAILIVFELTRNYELTTAVMITVVFSNVIAYRLFGRSLFDQQLVSRGIDLSRGRDSVVLSNTLITDYVTTGAVTVPVSATLADARLAMLDRGCQECIVLDDLSHYVGKLRLANVLVLQQRTSTEVAVAEFVDTDALKFLHDISVRAALESMQDFTGECIPVVDGRGFYIGVIYHSTMVAAYLKTLSRLRAEEHGID